MEDVVARPALTDVACGGGVRPTARAGLSQQPDVALLAPGGAPAVPHNPVVRSFLRAVADQLDAVVELDVVLVVAASEDPTVVILEGAGSHRYSERTNSGDVVHDGILVVDWELVVAGDGDHRSEGGEVVVAGLGLGGGAGHVGIGSLGKVAEAAYPYVSGS